MTRLSAPAACAAIVLAGFGAPIAQAQGTPSTGVVFENVRIYDGASDSLSPASNVLVVGNTIRQVSAVAIVVPAGTDVQRIQGNGRTLMPGLIDAHAHMTMADTPFAALMSADPNYVTLIAGRGAAATLMRGFTSVRDVGGPSFGL